MSSRIQEAISLSVCRTVDKSRLKASPFFNNKNLSKILPEGKGAILAGTAMCVGRFRLVSNTSVTKPVVVAEQGVLRNLQKLVAVFQLLIKLINYLSLSIPAVHAGSLMIARTKLEETISREQRWADF